ncbi:NAD-dependent epimerase/dehydratase family protein [Tunicatimonas pelagia]|uniref:NAD-dependent epimerase/dehydratase family protein n=1 Tax=Tunicatimonas pelagia TaxID=931531 RepID=UPI002665A05E|nr:NAD-dependent epimerase/dehydratase family protein [Tunicatimonas pelagia]WKN45444.1 NAD-dependent epimerase/dehydratase family protein [Tunicatimonas pelagia]
MKLLITGATGFVGRHVAQASLAKGHQVTGIVRSSDQAKTLKAQDIESVVSDLSETDLLRQLTRASDGVVHAAAANSPDWEETNHRVVTTFLDALEDTGKPLAMQGGTMVFGDTGASPLAEEAATFNGPPPLQGRIALERQFLEASQRGIRPLMIYGSYVYGGSGAAIPSIMKAAAQSSGYSAYVGEGANGWASVHIRDWADLFVLALENPQAQGAYFAATEVNSLKEIATIIDEATEQSSGTRSVSPEQAQALWSFFSQPLSFMNQRFSAEKAITTLGWHPKYSLEASTL